MTYWAYTSFSAVRIAQGAAGSVQRTHSGGALSALCAPVLSPRIDASIRFVRPHRAAQGPEANNYPVLVSVIRGGQVHPRSPLF